MGAKTKIEWTRGADGSPGATWTPIRARVVEIQSDGTGKERVGWHCQHVSEGCRNCYAESINRRLGTGLDFKPGEKRYPLRHPSDTPDVGKAELFLDEKMLMAPLRWRRPRMVFVCSMTDLFASFVPDEWIDRMFAVMALCPQHTFQVLTKRPERMARYMAAWPEGAARFHHVAYEAHKIKPGLKHGWPDGFTWELQKRWPLPNVWLGTSCEDQATADERRPHLAELAAAGWTTFCSYEPALGQVDWTAWEFLRQLISGGESGPNARPSHPDWHRRARDFCVPRGIAYFFKQWGEWQHGSDFARPGTAVIVLNTGRHFATIKDATREEREYWSKLRPEMMARVGKKAAGRLLDGRTWDQMPEVARG